MIIYTVGQNLSFQIRIIKIFIRCFNKLFYEPFCLCHTTFTGIHNFLIKFICRQLPEKTTEILILTFYKTFLFHRGPCCSFHKNIFYNLQRIFNMNNPVRPAYINSAMKIPFVNRKHIFTR